MALKPTIYKAKIALSDLDRQFFQSLNLTIAQHPSETPERMLARLLAFCINAEQEPMFTTGLSTPDEPDIIARDLSDSITLWIDVGEPAFERIKKASRIAKAVKIYSFNAKSKVWWQQSTAKFHDLKVEVLQMEWPQIQAMTKLIQRTMDFALTISEQTAFFSSEQGDCEISWVELQGRQ
jgi:uncharacterized protein YaeQ